jgi:hypothetical protein
VRLVGGERVAAVGDELVEEIFCSHRDLPVVTRLGH